MSLPMLGIFIGIFLFIMIIIYLIEQAKKKKVSKMTPEERDSYDEQSG